MSFLLGEGGGGGVRVFMDPGFCTKLRMDYGFLSSSSLNCGFKLASDSGLSLLLCVGSKILFLRIMSFGRGFGSVSLCNFSFHYKEKVISLKFSDNVLLSDIRQLRYLALAQALRAMKERLICAQYLMIYDDHVLSHGPLAD